jgi:hypothetical protein
MRPPAAMVKRLLWMLAAAAAASALALLGYFIDAQLTGSSAPAGLGSAKMSANDASTAAGIVLFAVWLVYSSLAIVTAYFLFSWLRGLSRRPPMLPREGLQQALEASIRAC